jgi:hypothetical protein
MRLRGARRVRGLTSEAGVAGDDVRVAPLVAERPKCEREGARGAAEDRGADPKRAGDSYALCGSTIG